MGVMFQDAEDWCEIWQKTDLCFQKWHWDFASFHRLRNSDLILESKIADLNHIKNSRQPNGLDAMWKLYFTFEINEWHNWQSFLHMLYRIDVLKVYKDSWGNCQIR